MGANSYGNLQGQNEDTCGPIYEIVVLPNDKYQLWFAGGWIFGDGPIGTYASIRAAMDFDDEEEVAS